MMSIRGGGEVDDARLVLGPLMDVASAGERPRRKADR
jgi:hypothetical protein